MAELSSREASIKPAEMETMHLRCNLAVALLCGLTSCTYRYGTSVSRASGSPAPSTSPKRLVASASARAVRTTPLLEAIAYGKTDLALRLIAEGADIEAGDEHGSTPLWFAAELGDTALIQALVKRGANVNARCIGGATPLHAAAEFADPQSVEYLIIHNANPRATDNLGYLPADYAKDSRHIAEANKATILRILDSATATTGVFNSR